MSESDAVLQRLPVRSTVMAVLVALTSMERNGYEILEHVASDQQLPSFLGPGSLYRTLKEMREDGLIEYRASPPSASDGRLRYHGLSALGRGVLHAETTRLQATFAAVLREPAS